MTRFSLCTLLYTLDPPSILILNPLDPHPDPPLNPLDPHRRERDCELERQQRIHEDILRYLSLRVDKHEEMPSVMMQGRKERGSRRDDEDGDDAPPKTETAAPETATPAEAPAEEAAAEPAAEPAADSEGEKE